MLKQTFHPLAQTVLLDTAIWTTVKTNHPRAETREHMLVESCRWLILAQGQDTRRGRVTGDKAGSRGHPRQGTRHSQLPWVIPQQPERFEFGKFCLLIKKWSLQYWKAARLSIWTNILSSVHQLCLWNHTCHGNEGNLPHHELIIFLWKKEVEVLFGHFISLLLFIH